MGPSQELELNEDPIYMGATWGMVRQNGFLRKAASPGRIRKRMAKVGDETMTGLWCRRTGMWFQDIKKTVEYREVKVRSVKTKEKNNKSLKNKIKSKRLRFPIAMEKIEEADVYKSMFYIWTN